MELLLFVITWILRGIARQHREWNDVATRLAVAVWYLNQTVTCLSGIYVSNYQELTHRLLKHFRESPSHNCPLLNYLFIVQMRIKYSHHNQSSTSQIINFTRPIKYLWAKCSCSTHNLRQQPLFWTLKLLCTLLALKCHVDVNNVHPILWQCSGPCPPDITSLNPARHDWHGVTQLHPTSVMHSPGVYHASVPFTESA